MVAYLETYVYTTGALAIVVLTIEVRTAVYNNCYYDDCWSDSPFCQKEQNLSSSFQKTSVFKYFVVFSEVEACLTCVCSSSPWCSPCVYSEGSSNHGDAIISRRTTVKCICTAIVYVSHWSRDITLYAWDLFLWAHQTQEVSGTIPRTSEALILDQQAAPVRTWIQMWLKGAAVVAASRAKSKTSRVWHRHEVSITQMRKSAQIQRHRDTFTLRLLVAPAVITPTISDTLTNQFRNWQTLIQKQTNAHSETGKRSFLDIIN